MILEVLCVTAFTLMFCALMRSESKRRITEAELFGVES